MRLMDTKYAGMAVGVGSGRILGRIHMADMEIGGEKIKCSYTVLEDNKVDLLFGLDNLKRHQCTIDLVDHRLRLCKDEFSVPFLADGEIQRNAFVDETLKINK